MNVKRLFAVCLAIAMTFALIALVACDKHQHSYTEWDYNDSQHWKVCPDDDAIDESSKAAHVLGADGKCECGYESPVPHQHSYTKWAYNNSQHWKVCPDDNAIDESSKASHVLGTDGKCECGYDPQANPPVQLDTREFYVVGGGQGTLKNGSWSECKSEFKFTKADDADENGKTVYTFTMTMYSDDNFKVILPDTISKNTDGSDKWDDAKVLSFANLDGAAKSNFKDSNGNITLDQDKDGEYRFTIRTTKDMTLASVKLEVELVKTVPGLSVSNKYDMYVVGTIASKPGCDWPGTIGAAAVPNKCIKMELQEDGETFSVTVKLATADRFKVWNYKEGNTSSGYYPNGMGNDLKVSNAGTYVISWKIGTDTPTIKEAPHVHEYTGWGFNDDEHWRTCPTDGAIDEGTRTGHTFVEGKCECGAEQATQGCDHKGYEAVFNYTKDNIPAPNGSGGTLSKVCSHCGQVVEEVEYTKGFNGGGTSAPTKVNVMGKLGTLFAHVDDGSFYAQGQVTGFAITEAGTYTISFETVLMEEGYIFYLSGLGINNAKSGTYTSTASSWFSIGGANGAITAINSGKWSTTTAGQKVKTDYNIIVDGMSDLTDPDNLQYVQIKSVTFTVTQEQINASVVKVDNKKAVAVLFKVQWINPTTKETTVLPAYKGDYLLTISKATTEAPATIAAGSVQQYAVLPSKH